MSNKIEHRSYAIRAAEGEEFVLAGRAVSYNQISSNELAPGLRERIMPGCFADSLASGRDVKALLNHQSTALPLGRLANGTLKIADSPEGLDFRIQLDRLNTFHQQVYASVRRADISECSFAFQCEDDDIQDGYTNDGERCQIRNVRKAALLDLSIVNTPFYGAGATQVDARSAGAVVNPAAKWLADQQGDWARRDKAHQIGMQVLRDLKVAPKEKRGNEDFMSMRDQLQAALPSYKVVGSDDDYVYAVDENEDEACVYRFGYELDADGHVTLDEASRTRLTTNEISSVRCAGLYDAAYAAFRQRDFDSRMRRRIGF